MDFKTKKKQMSAYDHNPTIYKSIVPTFEIKETLAYHYQVRNASHTFPGERHSYWELAFIDNDESEAIMDEETYQLDELDPILYVPGQYHTRKTGHAKSCSYLTIMFDMEILDSYLVTNRIYNTHRDIYNALNDLTRTFDDNMLYDSELMLCYMKGLFIKVLQYDLLTSSLVTSAPMQQWFENELLNEIVIFINNSIYEQVIIKEIYLKFSISCSSLQALFKNNPGVTPEQYINDLKLNKGKPFIKESVYIISEITSMMGFIPTCYFSRKFKQQFGITPADYAKTIYNQQYL